ncbi:phage tail assembly chaperone G [Ignavigranum ruoffiae]|uniref:phage tail assembly chaperone G n=1 Tax=Ignavigranum ruoffiae TaxID=89093 RepID=UPI0023559083|nr:hypothetical protein [Ignavigranum ruoffiae]
MEIILVIDGKEKRFKQDTVNYITIRKALEWKDRYQKQSELMNEYFESGIDGEPDPSIINESQYFDDYKELELTADLVVSFFNHQFTFDDFVNGYYVNNVREFHAIAFEIIGYVLTVMSEENTETKKKSQQKTEKLRTL